MEKLNKVVLVVDAIKKNQEISKDLLESIGFVVLIAESAKTAKKILDTEQIDLILSNMHFTDAEGPDFLKIVRANHRFDAIPFIFMLNKPLDSSVQQELISNGVNRFFIRPIDTIHFLQTIRDLFFTQFQESKRMEYNK